MDFQTLAIYDIQIRLFIAAIYEMVPATVPWIGTMEPLRQECQAPERS